MSKDVIMALFRAIDAREWTSLAEVVHTDVTYERPGYDRISGLDDLLRFYRETRIIESGTHYIEHIVADDRCGASWGKIVGTTKDGADVNEAFSDVYEFEDGKIRTRRSYFYRPCV